VYIFSLGDLIVPAEPKENDSMICSLEVCIFCFFLGPLGAAKSIAAAGFGNSISHGAQ